MVFITARKGQAQAGSLGVGNRNSGQQREDEEAHDEKSDQHCGVTVTASASPLGGRVRKMLVMSADPIPLTTCGMALSDPWSEPASWASTSSSVACRRRAESDTAPRPMKRVPIANCHQVDA